jgi:lipopolysaccharide export system permease protein
MKIIDRYLLRELAGPFLFGVAVFSIVLMAGMVLPKVMVLLTKGQIGLLNTLLYCIYMFPSFLVLTLAMSTLLGVLLGFGRLSSESEAVAMHAAGLSLPRLAVPAIIFGLAISLFTLALGEYVVPYTNHQAQIIFDGGRNKSLGKQKNVLLQEKAPGGIRRTFFAALMDTATGDMERVIITESQNWQPVGMVTGRLLRREGKTWYLYDSTVYTLKQGEPASSQQHKKMRITFSELESDFASQFKQLPSEMTYRELKEQIADLKHQHEDPIAFQVELPRRFSIPFVCLVFTLIGTPLGMRSHRRSSSPGMALTLLVVFFYYIFFYALGYGAWYHAVSPDLAAWLPNVVCSAVGLVLLFTSRK